jgi:hypothetical protein
MASNHIQAISAVRKAAVSIEAAARDYRTLDRMYQEQCERAERAEKEVKQHHDRLEEYEDLKVAIDEVVDSTGYSTVYRWVPYSSKVRMLGNSRATYLAKMDEAQKQVCELRGILDSVIATIGTSVGSLDAASSVVLNGHVRFAAQQLRELRAKLATGQSWDGSGLGNGKGE